MAAWDPPPDPPTHQHQKIFPQEMHQLNQRGPKLEVNFRYAKIFFQPLTPPPPVQVEFAITPWPACGRLDELRTTVSVRAASYRGGGGVRGGQFSVCSQVLPLPHAPFPRAGMCTKHGPNQCSLR